MGSEFAEGVSSGMTAGAAQASDVSSDLAFRPDAAVRAGSHGGSPPRASTRRLAIPARPEQVRQARTFVADALGPLHPSLDNAVLLTSELVTNALVHSDSGRQGGTIAILVADSAAGVRVEVTDAGSPRLPVVRGDLYAPDGRGLLLVQKLADRWGYVRDDASTTVWFWLAAG